MTMNDDLTRMEPDDGPLSRLVRDMKRAAPEVAGRHGLDVGEYVTALANVIGIVIAENCADEAEARRVMDGLARIMTEAHDWHRDLKRGGRA
jgi:hypothetical protein